MVIKTRGAIETRGCGDARLYISIGAILWFVTIGYQLAPIGTALHIFALNCIALPWLATAYGWGVYLRQSWQARSAKPTDRTLPDDAALPSICILLPLYKEANMVRQLAEMLAAIDYPAERLSCLILLEADDRTTLQAALKVKWPSFCQLVSVPDYGPQTKARACNHALRRCFSDVLVIFDAEDKPHPMQLREAAQRFRQADAGLVCLQAPLRIVPRPGMWLEHQFALEYRILFEVILPGLSRACAALPLGGSSNYFRTAALKQLGGWDAYNLTEDADLGVRLAWAGYRTQMLRLPTIENAPRTIDDWMPQRTRWLSGHLQTAHMHGIPRVPLRLIVPWAICMSVLLARLLSGPMHAFALWSLAWFAITGQSEVVSPPFIVLLAFGYGCLIGLCIIVSPCKSWLGRIGLAISHPIYFLLALPALLFAMKRMALGQLDWLKSPHRPYATGKRVERVKGIEPSS